MTTTSNNPAPMKAAICIRAMAASCGLSRQRFMQLVRAGVFPTPLYDVTTRRPFYSEDLQAQCLEVRKRNVGINGKVVMFYARRPSTMTTTLKSKKPAIKPTGSDRHADVVDGLKALGLVTVTTAQVAEAVTQIFPQGTTTVDPGEVIRAVFVHLHGKNSAGNVGRK
jgi:hypothetical protein